MTRSNKQPPDRLLALPGVLFRILGNRSRVIVEAGPHSFSLTRTEAARVLWGVRRRLCERRTAA